MKENHSERHKAVGELMAYRARVDFTQSSYQNHLVSRNTVPINVRISSKGANQESASGDRNNS